MKMKDKKGEEELARKLRKERLAAEKKKRREKPPLEREEPALQEKPTILIVCEGENTEPSYFTKFKLSSATIHAIGKGCNTLSLIKSAMEYIKDNPYDQVWCVFDKDDFSAQDFNQAIQLSIAQNFGVAYSNQSFEYWLLHFEDHQGGAMDRKEYEKTINQYIGPLSCHFDGTGSKLITTEFFALLSGKDAQTERMRIDLAIDRAKRNYANLPHNSPANEESSTTVFRLVEEILKHV